MPETRAQLNVTATENQHLSLDIISKLITDSTTTLQGSLTTEISLLTEEIKKVNDTLLKQQQDILSIRDVIIKNLQEENVAIK